VLLQQELQSITVLECQVNYTTAIRELMYICNKFFFLFPKNLEIRIHSFVVYKRI